LASAELMHALYWEECVTNDAAVIPSRADDEGPRNQSFGRAK
jgi:hypothetical protein